MCPETEPLEVDSRSAVALNRPDAESALPILAEARAIAVTDQTSANTAAEWRNGIKSWMDSNTKLAELDEKIAEAYGMHRYLCNIRNSIVNPRNEAIQIVDRKIKTWLREEEQRVEAEKQRMDAENRRKEEERRLQEAEAAKEQGAPEEQVEAILEAPIVTPAAPIQRPKVEGFRRPANRFKAEIIPVTGKMKLIKAVACVCGKCKCAGNPALLGLVDPNQSALNQMANAQKENLNLPGVKAVPA